jgi:hypothetical protein
MASAIEDVSRLPGETVNDQEGRKVGEVKEIYAVGEDETPMWVTVEIATGIGRTRLVFVPLARLKLENDELRVPYSAQHIRESPEVEAGEELSAEDEWALRVYYAIGLADQEMVDNAQSYASQVPDEKLPARKVEADSVQGPVREISDTPPGERTREADEKMREEQGEEVSKPRETTAADVLDDE